MLTVRCSTPLTEYCLQHKDRSTEELLITKENKKQNKTIIKIN
jgi:hypothetical protein